MKRALNFKPDITAGEWRGLIALLVVLLVVAACLYHDSRESTSLSSAAETVAPVIVPRIEEVVAGRTADSTRRSVSRRPAVKGGKKPSAVPIRNPRSERVD